MPRKAASKRKQGDLKSKVKVSSVNSSQPATSLEEPTNKIIKFTGKVPIDEGFPNYLNGPYHVHEEGDFAFNAMLNQTNIGQNNNKYYIIQLIKHNSKPEFIVLCRWGRVGKVAGKSESPAENENKAKWDFAKKFSSKTGNSWWSLQYSPDSFMKVKGKYDLVKIDYGTEIVKQQLEVKKKSDSKLPPKIQDLISLIFNKSEWEASVKEMKFDVRKSPLGKLTKEQIQAGYKSLQKIEEYVNANTSESKLEEACSEFYTRIPHDFGMKKPPLLKTIEQIKEKLELLDALNEIQIAITVMNEEKHKTDVNELDQYYKSLDCELEPLNSDSTEFDIIKKYWSNCKTGFKSYGFDNPVSIEDVFKVHREKDEKRFKKNLGNRMLLWHGSRITNWCGILKQGLRIAPPEAPCSGYSFGKGVYFADISSKSACFCRTSSRQPYGLLLVCEVALGKMNETTTMDIHLHKNLPKGKHSTKAVGIEEPNGQANYVSSNGAVMPLGKPKRNKKCISYMWHNEFVVYDVAQINPRYLVKIKDSS